MMRAGSAPSSTMAATVDLPRYPAASPDGSQVVFTWRGDLWRAPASGGEAVRLTTNPADDLHACFTPDGSTIVFESTREGARNLWCMPATGGEPRQLLRPHEALGRHGLGREAQHAAAHAAQRVEGALEHDEGAVGPPRGSDGTSADRHPKFGKRK